MEIEKQDGAPIEEGNVAPEKTLEPKKTLEKGTFVLVNPVHFQKVMDYLHNSIPKNQSVNEVLTLINNLNTSRQSEVRFDG